jgi:Domain of unknown function (DUF4604)
MVNLQFPVLATKHNRIGAISNPSPEANEPSFLRKLRSEYGGNSVRHEHPQLRPRKPKAENNDDEPTYVYEETNEYITKEEYESLVRDSKPEWDGEKTDKDSPSKAVPAALPEREVDRAEAGIDGSKPRQTLTEIGGPKKRKQAKVIGEENAVDNHEDLQAGSLGRKAKQKKKKIKLSFDEPEIT